VSGSRHEAPGLRRPRVRRPGLLGECLDRLHTSEPITELITGNADVADTLAGYWAAAYRGAVLYPGLEDPRPRRRPDPQPTDAGGGEAGPSPSIPGRPRHL
jgi:hypothetical protein